MSRRGPGILLVEDDPASAQAAATLMQTWGHPVTLAGSLAEARSVLEATAPEVIVLDLGLPDGDGMDLLVESQARPDPPAVIVLTGQRAVHRAVEAMRCGATDYLPKPVRAETLRIALQRVQDALADAEKMRSLRQRLARAGQFEGMIGRSTAMQKVYATVERVAPSNLPVFIRGESGTGKEVLARAIHSVSRRRDRAFVALNCGAIPKELVESELFGHERGSFTGATARKIGLFERADGGTLLLDELGEMPLAAQVVLLRVLETGTLRRVGGGTDIAVDVRVVAATNRDPEQAVAEGRLREDLFYRLHVFPIVLPPLRERAADIPLLAEHFLRETAQSERGEAATFTPRALAAMQEYGWPGNVRELRNVVSRAWVLAGEGAIDAADLGLGSDGLYQPSTSQGPQGDGVLIPPGTPLAEAERLLVLAELARHDNHRADTAHALGITPKTLYNKLKAWGVALKRG